MPRVSGVVALTIGALVALVLLWSPAARAQDMRPQGLHVLEIDSENADDQAEALTAALRSRVRAANGWVLLETSQSLSMLTAALRCPTRPDAACLQRIGDQLKTDQYLWGLITKAPGGAVTADVHRWTRGKPDLVATETYSENLKDQNDDTLRKIAGRLFERLTGGPSATVVVHVQSTGAPGSPWIGPATVVVDGNQSVVVDHGAATLSLSGGTHNLEVRASGFTAVRESVVAKTGASEDVNIALVPVSVVAPPPPVPEAAGGGGTSIRKPLTFGALIGGGVLVATGVVLGVVFEVERGNLESDLADNYGTHKNEPLISNPCEPPSSFKASPSNTIAAGCSANNTASSVAVPEAVTLGLGAALLATGVILLVTAPKEPAPPSTALVKDVRVLPEVGPRGGSLGLSLKF